MRFGIGTERVHDADAWLIDQRRRYIGQADVVLQPMSVASVRKQSYVFVLNIVFLLRHKVAIQVYVGRQCHKVGCC